MLSVTDVSLADDLDTVVIKDGDASRVAPVLMTLSGSPAIGEFDFYLN